jgi:hypothetical protein
MPRAQSEVIVPGPHGLVNYQETIAELKRILKLHLKAGTQSRPRTLAAAE